MLLLLLKQFKMENIGYQKNQLGWSNRRTTHATISSIDATDTAVAKVAIVTRVPPSEKAKRRRCFYFSRKTCQKCVLSTTNVKFNFHTRTLTHSHTHTSYINASR